MWISAFTLLTESLATAGVSTTTAALPDHATWAHLFGWGSPCRPHAGAHFETWGALSQFAGHVFHSGAQSVAFEWGAGCCELHVRFGDAGLRHVVRHVVITPGPEVGDLLFSDELGVPRGRGVLAGDGTAWFTELEPMRGCDASGAIYRRLPGGVFERQRFETRDNEIREEAPTRYVATRHDHDGDALISLRA